MILGSPAWAAFDEFSDHFSPKNFELRTEHLTLVLKGEIELELHDLQGRGGPGFDSVTDTRTLGTRSPFVEIDTFWLAPRLEFSRTTAVNSILEFTPRGTSVSAVWFDTRIRSPTSLEHHLEIGFHTPFIKVDRRTERYPLIGSIYWRQPEVHVAYEGQWAVADEILLQIGLSAAFMRPLALTSVQDANSRRGTINVVSYGLARPYSGNAPVWGAKLEAEVFGVTGTLFAFVGRLAAEAGTDELRSNFGNYRALDPGGRGLDSTFRWGGGRLAYARYGIRILAEAIVSQESLLRRGGAYIQAGYELSTTEQKVFFHSVEPIVRYEIYRIQNATVVDGQGLALRSPAPSQALTWDFNILTLGLALAVYRDLVRARIEYVWVDEINGVPGLNLGDQPIKNNELLVQLELRF